MSSLNWRTVEQVGDLGFQTACARTNRDECGERQSSVVPSPPVASARDVTCCKISERTDALVRGFRLLLTHHGAAREIQESLSKQMHSYLDTSGSETVWMKRAKHALTYPLSKYLKNEPPPAPDEVFKPAGALRGWMKARSFAFNRKNTHLWYSWLQLKRAALPVSDDIVDETYDKHFQTLSREDDGDWDAVNSIFSDKTFVSILEELRGDVTRAFETANFLEGRTSKSACFEQTRSSGGAIWQLRKLAGLTGPFDCQPELHSMVWAPRVYGVATQYNVVLCRQTFTGLDSWSQLGAHALWLDTTEPLSCTIQAVLEPMKVRVISKGNALPYYLARPLQKVLHDRMRTMDCFRLIGRPFCPTDMMDLRRMASRTDQWFSIDYSAATDGLSYRYSGRILRWLTADLADWDREMLENALGMHKLHYPKGRGVEFRGMQRRGQLMGSILSFVILCLANLGVYLSNTGHHHRNWTRAERLGHVLVNGDDMLYAAPLELWASHVTLAGKVGLEMSVGKAYHHSSYANVNSTSVHYDLAAPRETTTPWQIEYLNTGLFFGQHKVLGSRDDGKAKAHMSQSPAVIGCSTAESGFVSTLNCVVRGSLPGRACSLLRDYLVEHAEDIRDECRTRNGLIRNLFLPESSGGMGCFAPPGWRWSCSSAQRTFGWYLLRSQSANVSAGLPLPGYEVTKFEDCVEVVWFKPERELTRPRSQHLCSDRRAVLHLPAIPWSVRSGEWTV